MAFNLTIEYGYAVQGDVGNPAKGTGGLVQKWSDLTFINPSYCVWKQTGAPFGSVQTVHSVATGALPPGITIAQDGPGGPNGFSQNNFGIQGVPTAVGVYTGTFAASGGFGGDSFTITVAYHGSCGALSITPTSLTGGNVGSAYSQAFSSTGSGSKTFDLMDGSLPTGLSLSSAGVLSGTPLVDGTFNFTIRSTDASGCIGIQALSLTIANFVGQRVTQAVVLTMAPNIVACPTPDEGEDLCNTIEDPVIFTSLNLNGTALWSAQCCLDDDDYGGYKEDRLLSVGEIRRSLSGPNLDYEVGSFSVEYADDDYALRRQLSAGAGRYWNKKEIEVYMRTPTARTDGTVARRIALGAIDTDPEYDTRSDAMTVKFTCRDRIGTSIGWTNTGQSKVPRRVLSGIVLPGCTTSALGLTCPIPYGLLTTNIASSGVFTAPILDVDASHCGFFDGAYPAAGYGNWSNPPVVPSGVSVSVVAGGAVTTHTPHDEGLYCIQVYPVAANGDVGDPYPFCFENLTATVTPGNQTINVSWLPSAGAASYIVMLGTFYYGPRPQQYIQTTGLSVSFTRSPDWPNGATMDTITPGARTADDAQITYYTVRSKNGNTVSEISPTFAFQSVSCPRFPNNKFRPVRIWWQSTGAPEYEVLSAGPGNAITDANYQWKWIVSSGNYDAGVGLHYFDNDFLYTTAIPFGAETARPQGAMQPIYTRDVVINTDTWREFMIAGVAIQGVDDWYYDPGGPVTAVETNQGDGTEWLFPTVDMTKQFYTFFNAKYRDIVGIDGRTRRFAMGYGRGSKADLVASGQAKITLNIRGVDTAATGMGDLLTDLHDQFKHLLENVIAVSGEGYLTGPYASTPTMGTDGICAIDVQSIRDLKAQRMEEFAGGIQGAGIVGANGEAVSVTEELKRWSVSGDFRLGPNRHWQIMAVGLNTNQLGSDITTVITDEFDIHVRSFKPQPRLGELYNVIPYKYKRNHVGNGWYVDNQLYTNDDSISRWNVRQESSDVEFHYLRDSATTLFVLGKRAERMAEVPYYITLEGSMCLMAEEYDLGKYVKVTHWRGVKGGGWTERVMWVISNTFNPENRRVQLVLQDLGDVISSCGIMPIGMPFTMCSSE